MPLKALFLVFFYSVLRPFQDYFRSYETGQSVGGAKTGEPREKPPDTPARTWLVSHVARLGLEATPDTAVRILTFISRINYRLWHSKSPFLIYFGIYEQFKFYALPT